jgi:hypothetical protein
MSESLRDLLDRCDIGMNMGQYFSEEQRTQLGDTAREIAYTGIGLGILGFQRAQVLRREYQPAVEQFISDLRTHLR